MMIRTETDVNETRRSMCELVAVCSGWMLMVFAC